MADEALFRIDAGSDVSLNCRIGTWPDLLSGDRAGKGQPSAARPTIVTELECLFVSRARYTSPMPPSPILAVTSYGPRAVPGIRDMGQSSAQILAAV